MSRPTEFPIKKIFAMSDGMAEQITTLRFDLRVKSESELLRQLVQRGLDALKAEHRGQENN